MEGKCQRPPVISGTHTGTGGGFIQMFPTCSEGKTYDKATNACVAKTAEATTCSVEKPGAVYNRPGGTGQKTGELAAQTQGVVLLKRTGPTGFRSNGPAEKAGCIAAPAMRTPSNASKTDVPVPAPL
jgi:hypothetical protein